MSIYRDRTKVDCKDRGEKDLWRGAVDDVLDVPTAEDPKRMYAE